MKVNDNNLSNELNYEFYFNRKTDCFINRIKD